MEKLTEKEKQYLLELIKADEKQLSGIKGTSTYNDYAEVIKNIKIKLELNSL